MFPIYDNGRFKIYMPRSCDIESGIAIVNAANAKNAAFMTSNPPQKTTGGITGSFICAHAPDYRGRPMLDATVEEWGELFAELRSYGMDTAIFQAAIWAELEECFYNSVEFSRFRAAPVIERMLEAAAGSGVGIYLGGYGSVIGWSQSNSEAAINAELAKHRKCFQEISRLGEVKGFYFPCECAFTGSRNLRQEEKINRLYRNFGAMVKDFDSTLEIISSPGTHYFSGREQEFIDSWQNTLRDVPLDILMPQDSIGCCVCALNEQSGMWKLWHDVCRAANCRLWANIEIFERRSFTAEVNLYPASLDRIAHQINNTAPFVEKLCCWEAPYFASPLAGDEGVRLRNFLQKGI